MIETIRWSALSPEQRDTHIAEKIMGNPISCKGELRLSMLDEVSPVWWRCLVCGMAGECLFKDVPQNHLPPIPHYSTDMDAAWRIVVKLKGAVLDASYKHDMLLCRATFVTVDSEYHAYGRMPEAICIAALRANGYEVIL